MTVVLALLLVGAALTAGAPFVLRLSGWQIRNPQVALCVWVVLFVAGCSAFLASACAAVVTAVMVAPTSSAGWLVSTAVMVLGWTMLGAIGALSALVATNGQRWAEGSHATRAQLVLLRACAAYRTDIVSGVEVCYVDASVPIAVGTRDDGPRVVISRGLAEQLTPVQARAVVQHEVAHLRWWHDRIAALAGVAHVSIPGLPAGRSFSRSVRLLVELAADQQAAEVCGAEACASALERLGELDGHTPGLDLRAHCLRAPIGPPSGASRRSRARTRVAGRFQR